MHILVKDDPHNGGLGFVDSKLINLMLAFVETPAFDEIIAIGSNAALKTAVLNKLAEGSFGTDRSLFAFAVRLPKPDVVGELVRVAVKALFALLGAPDFDAVFYEPFHHKRRFVSDTPDAVKHKN